MSGFSNAAFSPWVAFTPIVTPTSGAITSYIANGEYCLQGTLFFFNLNINIVDNGTGAGRMLIQLPFVNASSLVNNVQGIRINAGVLAVMAANVNSASDTMDTRTFQGNYPGVTSALLYFSGSYRIS